MMSAHRALIFSAMSARTVSRAPPGSTSPALLSMCSSAWAFLRTLAIFRLVLTTKT